MRSIDNLTSIASKLDEILVIDDGSTDVDDIFFSKLIQADSRIKVIRNSHAGIVESLNLGIRMATNEIIVRADVDDIYAPGRIDKQVLFLEQNPTVDVVFSDYQMVNLNGKNLGLFASPVDPELTCFSLTASRRTAHSSVAFRKSVIMQAGGYLAEDFPAEDLGLWIRVSKLTSLASIPEPLLYYTVHSGSVSRQRQFQMRSKSYELRKQHGKRYETIQQIEHLVGLAKGQFHLQNFQLRLLFFLSDLWALSRISDRNLKFDVRVMILRLFLENYHHLLPVIARSIWMKVKRKFYRIK